MVDIRPAGTRLGTCAGYRTSELATGGTGRYATHVDDVDPAGIPGWHMISSGVLGYGPDDASNEVLQAAVLDSQILRALAAELTPALDRPELNGIKVFLGRPRTRPPPRSESTASRPSSPPKPWPRTLARWAAPRDGPVLCPVAVHPS